MVKERVRKGAAVMPGAWMDDESGRFVDDE